MAGAEDQGQVVLQNRVTARPGNLAHAAADFHVAVRAGSAIRRSRAGHQAGSDNAIAETRLTLASPAGAQAFAQVSAALRNAGAGGVCVFGHQVQLTPQFLHLRLELRDLVLQNHHGIYLSVWLAGQHWHSG